MILEVEILDIKPGQEAKFESACRTAESIIQSMQGYLSHQLQHCIENPSRYLLLKLGYSGGPY